MLRQRFFTACILFLVVLGILFYAPSSWFIVLVWLLCLVGIYELTAMYKFDKINQIGLMVVLTLLAFLLYFVPRDINVELQVISLITWCVIAPIILIIQPKYFSHLSISILATIIFVPAFYALVTLYNLLGSWYLLSIMFIAWISDTGAYFIGKKYGRHKFAPKISPNKSVEGALGGIFFVLIYLICLKTLGYNVFGYTWISIIKCSLILTIVGIVGDLFESCLKRGANVKDSGMILPGHGGIFDRVDSLFAIIAVAFAILIHGV